MTRPLVAGKKALSGKPTAYDWKNGTCAYPTTEPMQFADQTRAIPAKPSDRTQN